MNWRRRRWHARDEGATGSPTTDRAHDAGVPIDAEGHVASSSHSDEAAAEGATQGTTERDGPQERSGRIVAITNQKGGVGKTTTAISLAAALAAEGVAVLLVDLDPQGNASTGLDLRVASGQASTYHILIDRLPAGEAIIPTGVEHLDLVPSSIDLAGAEVELVAQMNRERRLARALEDVRSNYDVIFLDCPPSLGILTLNALVAADEALVPIQCEYYALEGVSQLLRTIHLVQEDLNAGLHIGGVLMTMFDARTNLSQQVADEIRAFFGDTAYTTVIPRTVRLSEAPSFGQPITVFDPSSRGARAYQRLAREAGQRLGLLEQSGADALDDLLGISPGATTASNHTTV